MFKGSLLTIYLGLEFSLLFENMLRTQNYFLRKHSWDFHRPICIIYLNEFF